MGISRHCVSCWSCAPWQSGYDIHDFCGRHLWCWEILVQWILHTILNRLLQYHLSVQLDLCIFGALSPIRHSSNDRCPSVTQKELLRPSSLLHRSPLSCFWLSSGSTPKISQFFPFLVHCCFRCRNFHGLRHRNKLVNQIVVLQWILTFSCNMVFVMMRQWFSHTQSCRFTSFQNTRKFCFVLLDAQLPQFFMILQGIAGATDVSNFLRAFLMVSLNSLFSGSMKYIPLNFRAFSRWIFSSDHFCFSFSLAFFPTVFQISGHKWSGLDVSCFLVNLSPDHMYPSGGFSSNKVNWVKPVQESDKSRDPSTFQKSSMRFSCLTSKFVWVVLDTSMYFSGIGNGSSLGE